MDPDDNLVNQSSKTSVNNPVSVRPAAGGQEVFSTYQLPASSTGQAAKPVNDTPNQVAVPTIPTINTNQTQTTPEPNLQAAEPPTQALSSLPVIQPGQHYQLTTNDRLVETGAEQPPVQAIPSQPSPTSQVNPVSQLNSAEVAMTDAAVPPPASMVASDQTKIASQIIQAAGQQKRQWRRHLKPLGTSALIGLFVYGVFNSQIIFGQIKYLISPGASAEAPAFFDQKTAVSADPVIIIPKINLNVPVVYDVTTFDETAVEQALQRGVVHYGTTALPGQLGNNVIVGHSSNNWWVSGRYKFAFVLLNKLDIGDVFYLNYHSKRYSYEVTDKKIISPSDTSALNQNVSVPTVSLITCDPPGTSWHRLVVQAKQIDPDPAKAKPAASSPTPTNGLPGDGQSIFDKIRQLI